MYTHGLTDTHIFTATLTHVGGVAYDSKAHAMRERPSHLSFYVDPSLALGLPPHPAYPHPSPQLEPS